MKGFRGFKPRPLGPAFLNFRHFLTVHKRDQLRNSIHFIPNFACHDPGGKRSRLRPGGDPQSADGQESSLGSAQDYEEQQAEVAAELSNYGIVRAPSVIFAVPIGPYYVPRTFSSAAPVFRVVPRPSIVPHGVPGPVRGFPRGFFGGFHGGGFSHMSGFHGRFGHR